MAAATVESVAAAAWRAGIEENESRAEHREAVYTKIWEKERGNS